MNNNVCHTLSYSKHSGDLQGPKACFFIPEPGGIGKILSAETDMTKTNAINAKPKSISYWWIPFATFATINSSAAFLIGAATENVFILALAIAIGLFVSKLLANKISINRCSFIGEKGFTIAKYKNNGDHKLETILFSNIKHIHTSKVHNYYNGIYMGTSLNLELIGHQGEILTKIISAHREKGLFGQNRKKQKSPMSIYSLAKALDEKWFTMKKPEFENKYAKGESLHFPLRKKNQSLTIKKGKLTIHKKGKDYSITANECKKAWIQASTIQIKTESGKKHIIEFIGMAESRLFFHFLNKALGIHFSS